MKKVRVVSKSFYYGSALFMLFFVACDALVPTWAIIFFWAGIAGSAFTDFVLDFKLLKRETNEQSINKLEIKS